MRKNSRMNSRWMCLFTIIVLGLVVAANPHVAFAQPGGSEVDALKAQMERLQARLQQLNDQQADDDPFGQRARTVGRKRAPVQPLDDDTLTIRFYDLSDIFSVAPQYPAYEPMDLNAGAVSPIFGGGSGGRPSGGGGFGGGGGGVFSLAPPTRVQQQAQNLSLDAARVSVDGLIQAIKDTVSPDDWDDSSGEASINILGNTLLISATDDMHQQITNLLNLIREHWGKLKTVSVQAFWIRATPASIKQLMEGDDPNRAAGKVNSKLWLAFFDKASQEKRIAYTASLSGHNGQTLNTVSGRRQTFVTDGEVLFSTNGRIIPTDDPVEAADNEDYIHEVRRSIAGVQPIRQSIQQGAALQISPFATRGGNFVILDLHTRVNEIIPKAEDEAQHKILAFTEKGVELAMPLDQPNYVSYRLSTTLRCPKDEVILAGGMTFDASTDSDVPSLYLFVQSRIHTIEEDKSDVVLD